MKKLLLYTDTRSNDFLRQGTKGKLSCIKRWQNDMKDLVQPITNEEARRWPT